MFIGILLALLTLVRPVAQWFIVCVVPVIWAASDSVRRAVKATVVIAVVNFVLVMPWITGILESSGSSASASAAEWASS